MTAIPTELQSLMDAALVAIQQSKAKYEAEREREAEEARKILAAEIAAMNHSLPEALHPYHTWVGRDNNRYSETLLKIPGLAEIVLKWRSYNLVVCEVKKFYAHDPEGDNDEPSWRAYGAADLNHAIVMAALPEYSDSYAKAKTDLARKVAEGKESIKPAPVALEVSHLEKARRTLNTEEYMVSIAHSLYSIAATLDSMNTGGYLDVIAHNPKDF